MSKTKCKKFDLTGKEIGDVEVAYDETKEVPSQLIKDYIVALRANARQWSANTKGRSESQHSGAKPHAQKGTGKARQGFLGAPQYKGGGRVGGPKPKFDQHIKINQKEKRAAIKALLIEKLKSGDLFFLQDDLEKYLPEPKTKVVGEFLHTIGCEGKRIVFLGQACGEKSTNNFKLSMRNISKTTYLALENVNGYDLLVNQKIMVLESAKETLMAVLRG